MRATIRADQALLLAGLGTFVVMCGAVAIYGAALPAFARRFAIPVAEAGLLIPSHWIGCAVGVALMFAAGHAVRLWQVLGTMTVAASLIAIAPAWPLTLAGTALFGAGYGAATVLLNQRFLVAFGARGPAMLSLLNAVAAVGSIAAPLLFIAVGARTGIVFAGVAVLAVATLGAALAVHHDPGPAPAARGRYQLRPGILAFGAIAIGIEACLTGLGPLALVGTGLTEARAAALLSGFFVALLAARTLMTVLAARLPAFALLIGALAVAGVLSLGAATLAPAACFVALGACTGVFFPAYFIHATALMGDHPRVPSTIIAAGLVGGITAPLIVGQIMGGQMTGGLGGAAFFWTIGALALTTAGAGLIAGRAMRTPAGA